MMFRFRHRVIGPVVIFWLTITVASVVMGTMAWSRLSRRVDASAKAEQFRESVNQLFSALQNAETSQRGFLLTGKEAYLETFLSADKTFPKLLNLLGKSALHHDARREDLLELHGLIEIKMTDLRQGIALRREKGLDAAVALMDLAQAKTTMNRIREIMERSRHDPFDLLSARGETAQRDMKSMHGAALCAGLLGIGTGLFALCFGRAAYDQERAQGQLLEEKLNTEQALQEKSAFLANMSHEIRTPMNAILGFSELLEPEGLTAKQSQYVRAIRDSGASLLQLINDILDLSKLEAGKLNLYPEATDMRDSCEFLRIVFGQQAMRKALQLQFELSPDLPRALLLDRLRLRQVLMNLLGNAIKFTDRGYVKTRVSWQTQESGSNGTLLIDVEDTGMGIAPDKLQEVFKAFVQADSRRTAEKQGTGLGLTIVKRLTEAMEGTLTLESNLGKGTVFHLCFRNVPVSARLPVGDHAKPEGALDFNDFAPATLLVVDDNDVNQNLMAGMFEKSHHRLHFASNGKEALECLEKFKVDVVLLDLRMPVMDGRTALEEIRRRPGLASLPIIALTASSPVDEETNLRSHFSDYIRKPFSRQTLFQALAGFLQRVPPEESLEFQYAGEPVTPILNPLPSHPADWRVLAVELRRLLCTEWPALHDSLAINATCAFAHELRVLGQAAHCGLLTAYATTLASLAEAYAIGQLEVHLAKFPKLVETIEVSSAQPLHV